jgi:1-phosphofructokinase
MILTITPAPALDLTLDVDILRLGSLNQSHSSTQEASGKGVNVSWALHRAGVATLALFPAGGAGAAIMTSQLSSAGVAHHMLEVSAELRTNVTVRPRNGAETKINSPGSPLTESELAKFLAVVEEALQAATLVCISGSAPQNAPETLHAQFVKLATVAGVPCVVDTSGVQLRNIMSAQPDLIAPNIHELAQLTGRALPTFGAVIDACEDIRLHSTTSLLVSLGDQGALLVSESGALWGRAERVNVVNSVGAGDALLAGFISADEEPAAKLDRAIWWASCAVEAPSTLFSLNPSLRSRVRVSAEFSRDTVVG